MVSLHRTTISRYDGCVHSLLLERHQWVGDLSYVIVILVAVVAIAYRLAIAGPFGPFPRVARFYPKSWQRWIFDEPSETKKKTN